MMRPRWTVRQALAVMLGVTLLPLVLGATGLLSMQWETQRKAADAQLLALARNVAQGMDRELAAAQARLHVAGASELIAAGRWDEFHAFARRALQDMPGSLLAVVDAQGQLLVNTGVAPGTPLPNVWALGAEHAEREWHGQRLPVSSQALTRTVLATGLPQFSDLYFGVGIGRPALAVAMPVRQGDGVHHVATLSFPPAVLQEVVDSLVSDPEMSVVVLDRALRVVASTAAAGVGLGQRVDAVATPGSAAGMLESVTPDGIQMVGAYTVSSTNGFTVAVNMPRATAYAVATRSATVVAVVCLAVLLAGATAATRLARRLTSDFDRLAALAGGEVEAADLAAPDAFDETATVGQALRAARAAEARQLDDALRRRLAEEQRAVAAASEQRLRRLVDNLFSFVGVLDLEGRLVEVNRAPVERAGLGREDVLGQLFWECPWWTHDASVSAGVRESVARAARGETVRYDVQVRMAGDRLITIDFQVAPIRDADGRVTHVVPSGVDITDRVQAAQALQDSEARLRALADHIPQLAWSCDPDGHLHWVNQRFVDYTGTPLEALRAWDWTQAHHPDHAERVRAKFRRHLASGEPWEDTFPLRRRDGAWRWFLSRAVPIRAADGAVARWFGTNTDITDQRETEQALRESRERLIAREQALSEADRQKDQFLATLAHELRNPLAPILTSAQVIRRREPADPVVARAGATILRQTGHLARLVDDLLDVSRITLGVIALRRERIELQQVVASAVEAARPAIDAAGHRLRVVLPPAPLHVDGDPTRLEQVVSNLLGNALKFTPGPGDIHVALQAAGGWATLAVSDTGRGIASHMRESIFELFVQEQGSGMDGNTGLGIGLALSRRLVELHGGTIAAESEGLGRGSRFVVRLPLAPEVATPQTAPAAGPGGRAGRVLVVDDNVDAAHSLAELLRLEGVDVATAHDGASALAAQRAQPAATVILDIGLPDIDGYEVATRMRRAAGGAAPLLVALTGWGQAQDAARARDAGFDHHLTKPADPSAILRLLAPRAGEG